MTPTEIKTLRLALGLTQTEFLEKLKIASPSAKAARQMVRRWELGEREPSPAALVLLRQLQKRHLGRQAARIKITID